MSLGRYEFPHPPEKGVPIEFMQFGNCMGMDPDLFFPERGDTKKLLAAKAVCQGCIVSEDCLNYALTPPLEKWGIWGGTSERERRAIRNRIEYQQRVRIA